MGLRGQEEAKLLPLSFPMLSAPSADDFSPSRNSNTILGRNISSIKKLISSKLGTDIQRRMKNDRPEVEDKLTRLH